MRRIIAWSGGLTLVLGLLLSPETHAAPAAPQAYTLHQPDGSTFPARSYGDEWSNGVETSDGYTILLNAQTLTWEYAVRGPDGRLQPSGIRVGAARPAGLVPHLRPDPALSLRPAHRWPVPTSNPSADPCAGPAINGRTLIILVSFQDQAPLGTTAETWREIFFGSSQSVRDFYREVSYDQLFLTPAAESYETVDDGIIGWLSLSRDHPDTRGQITGANRELTADALRAADPYVNFADFDTNGDGVISSCELHLVVIVAGYEAAYGGVGASCQPGSIWAHHWAFQPGEAPLLDGVLLGDEARGGGYAQFGEWHCASFDHPGHPATIGVIAHELGHDLGRGAPDLYDIDGSSWGVGDWDLMSTGAWNGVAALGDSPAHPSVWTKWFFGWINPIPSPGEQLGLVLGSAETDQKAFYLLGQNPNGLDWSHRRAGTGEYFLIENRQKIGFDRSLPGQGLLIWHIDESAADNSDEAHRLVDLEEAGGLQKMDCIPRGAACPYGNQGDLESPFPGSSGARTFDATSVPSSHYYDGRASGIALANLTESGGRVTLDLFVSETPPLLPLNRAPIAVVNPDLTVEIGSRVQLDGTASSDPDGDALQYTWRFLSAPLGSKNRPGRALAGPAPSWTADREGLYEIQLTVDDRRGGRGSASVRVRAFAPELFYDDLESERAGWVSVGPAQRLDRSELHCDLPVPNEFSSEAHLWYLGDPAQCLYSQEATLYSPAIAMQEATKVGIRFNYFLQLRRGDQVSVHASFDGSIRWRKLWSTPKQQGQWASAGPLTLSVPRGAGTLVLRFRLVRTSKLVTAAPGLGWLIDDLRVIKLAGRSSVVRGPSLSERDALQSFVAQRLLSSSSGQEDGYTARAEVFSAAGRLLAETGWAALTPEGIGWSLVLQSKRIPANGVYLVVLSWRDREGKIVSRTLIKTVRLY